MDKERLLIISNNVLSTTRNNGKTILSYFDCLPKEQVCQLYFSAEQPQVEGYRYFQISDSDILRGWLNPSKRGRACAGVQNTKSVTQEGAAIPRKPFFRILREVLWYRKWKSGQLLSWLDEVKPTAVFFVGGDCAFAYDICQFVVNRYRARLTLYITDDYVITYPEDSMLIKYRKSMLRKKLRKCLEYANCFYTVSQPMQRAYAELFGMESKLAVNMPESLKTDTVTGENEKLTLLYAGSLYYGRAEVLSRIAEALHRYNCESDGKKAILNVYTNTMPDEATRKMLEKDGAAQCCGSLGPEELKEALNQADVLVFAESFDEEQIRKTRFSLSTKIPEYLSVGKPILAVGPKGIGSIDYLDDTAFCITDVSMISEKMEKLLSSSEIREKLAIMSIDKYEKCHRKEYMQREMIKSVVGKSIYMEDSK